MRMDKKTEAKALTQKQRRLLVVAGAVIVAIVLAALLINQLATPKRSVAAYCKTYTEEKARLAKLPGDSYPSGVFSDEISDVGEFVVAFDRLEKVAPDEISTDVATLKSLYKQIDDDPSKAVSAAISGGMIDDSVKKWTNDHCSN